MLTETRSSSFTPEDVMHYSLFFHLNIVCNVPFVSIKFVRCVVLMYTFLLFFSSMAPTSSPMTRPVTRRRIRRAQGTIWAPMGPRTRWATGPRRTAAPHISRTNRTASFQKRRPSATRACRPCLLYGRMGLRRQRWPPDQIVLPSDLPTTLTV